MRVHETPERRKADGEKRKRSRRPQRSLAERGFGPAGGGWNIAGAAFWSGLSEIYIRALIKRHEAGEEVDVFPYHRIGRRIVIPREGFKTWFNAFSRGSVA
jgi:hypothetical protein